MSVRYINISIFAIKAITNECSIYAIPFMYIICDTKINRRLIAWSIYVGWIWFGIVSEMKSKQPYWHQFDSSVCMRVCVCVLSHLFSIHIKRVHKKCSEWKLTTIGYVPLWCIYAWMRMCSQTIVWKIMRKCLSGGSSMLCAFSIFNKNYSLLPTNANVNHYYSLFYSSGCAFIWFNL